MDHGPGKPGLALRRECEIPDFPRLLTGTDKHSCWGASEAPLKQMTGPPESEQSTDQPAPKAIDTELWALLVMGD